MNIQNLKNTKIVQKLVFRNVVFGIITANQIEFNGVLKSLAPFIIPNIVQDKIFHYNNNGLDYYLGSISDINVCLMQCPEMGVATQRGSLYAITKMISDIDPDNLIMLGVCCGMKTSNNKTQIYVSNLITYYEYGKLTQSEFINRSATYKSTALLKIFQEVETEEYAANTGYFICGEKVLTSKKVKDKLIKLFPGVAALDMESYSLAVLANDKPYVVIKGASDNGNNKVGSENQEKTMKYVLDYVKKCIKKANAAKLLQSQKQRINLFISGCSESYVKNYSPEFINELSTELFEYGFKIINGYGKGIGEHLILSARMYDAVKMVGFNEILNVFPFPINNNLFNDGQYKELAANNRKTMVDLSEISLFLYGNKDNLPSAQGVLDEYNISITARNILVPLGATGYDSASLHKKTKNVVSCYNNSLLNQYYEKLDRTVDFHNVDDRKQYIKEIIQYIFCVLQCAIEQ